MKGDASMSNVRFLVILSAAAGEGDVALALANGFEGKELESVECTDQMRRMKLKLQKSMYTHVDGTVGRNCGTTCCSHQLFEV